MGFDTIKINLVMIEIGIQTSYNNVISYHAQVRNKSGASQEQIVKMMSTSHKQVKI